MDLKNIVRKILRHYGYVINSNKRITLSDGTVHEGIHSRATYAPWLTDENFIETYNRIVGNTLVEPMKCYELFHLVQQVSKLDGDIVEVGVWRGGTGALLAKGAELSGDTAMVYLCDTFSGVVKASSLDDKEYYSGGEHNDTSIVVVDDLLAKLSVKNAVIKKGVFPEDVSGFFEEKKFKFCHIDVDVAESAKDIFNFVWPRLVVGGIVVYDDYGFISTVGIAKHVNEVVKSVDGVFVYNVNGHAVIIKTGN